MYMSVFTAVHVVLAFNLAQLSELWIFNSQTGKALGAINSLSRSISLHCVLHPQPKLLWDSVGDLIVLKKYMAWPMCSCWEGRQERHYI